MTAKVERVRGEPLEQVVAVTHREARADSADAARGTPRRATGRNGRRVDHSHVEQSLLERAEAAIASSAARICPSTWRGCASTSSPASGEPQPPSHALEQAPHWRGPFELPDLHRNGRRSEVQLLRPRA
jgi:hypothetical protein